MGLSNLRTMLQADPALAQTAAYLFGAQQRQDIDEQIQIIETYALKALLSGVKATFLTLDGASASVSPGDAICSTSLTLSTVTRAVTGAVNAAGGAAGVALLGAPPGGRVLTALRGLVPAALLGSVTGSGVYAQVGSNARVVASSSAGQYALGTLDAVGNLTLHPRSFINPYAPGPSSLAVSVVDIALGRGTLIATPGIFDNVQNHFPGSGPWSPTGVGFGVTSAGHFCPGARFCQGDTHPYEIALWRADGTKMAFITAAGGGGAVTTATFASAVALSPGVKYCVTFYDLYVHNGSIAPDFPNYWYYAGGARTGLRDMSAFLPYGGNQSVPWGPFAVGADFINGSSPNNVYGLGGHVTGGNVVPFDGGTAWYPIEPTLV